MSGPVRASVRVFLTNPESGYESETEAKVSASEWVVIDAVLCGRGQVYTAAPDLLKVCAAIAPYLGAVDANDWHGLKDDDAISMPVKMRVGDLRALKTAIARATEAQP